MNTHQTARRRTALAAAAVVAIVLVIVAAGYPDWAWFPLVISFFLAVPTFIVAVGLEIRSRFVRP